MVENVRCDAAKYGGAGVVNKAVCDRHKKALARQKLSVRSPQHGRLNATEALPTSIVAVSARSYQ